MILYLNCHTCYSLRYGIFSARELVRQAKIREIRSLALTDINNASALLDFISACRDHGIHAIAGLDFRDEGRLLYIGIAKNNNGFLQLNRFLSHHSFGKKRLPRNPWDLEDVHFIFPLARMREEGIQLRGDDYVGVMPRETSILPGSSYLQHPDRLLAYCPVTLPHSSDLPTHRLLQSIDQNTLLSRLDHTQGCHPSDTFQDPSYLDKCYKLFPQLPRRAEVLMENCSIELDLHGSKNKRSFTSSCADDASLLRALTLEGMEHRYGKNDPAAQARVEKELEVIGSLQFGAYFLITWDMVRYAHHRGFEYMGRGSGANSIVAYCLRLTDVDPMDLGLYFERFINHHRAAPPDFDIDFSWDQRDHVVDYMMKRYGQQHVAMLATYNTFQWKAAVRETSKVYGLPGDEIEALTSKRRPPTSRDGMMSKVLTASHRIAGLPNYLGIHAGGIIITEKPLCNYTPLRLMPKGIPITHFDMHVAEDYQFHKHDILSQRGLGHIRMATQIIRENRGVDVRVDKAEMIKKDPKVRRSLREADALGCFYIESPAMRGLLKKLRCEQYLHLVAASSIIRPGVASSGMMEQYIRRFRDTAPTCYLHPIFEQHLSENLRNHGLPGGCHQNRPSLRWHRTR